MSDETYRTVADALEYICSLGRKVGKSKFYADVRGNFPPKRNGVFHRKDLKRYAETLPVANASDKEAGAVAELAEEKARLEIEKLEEQIKRERQKRLREEGKLIAREDVEAEMAARAVTLETGLKTSFETRLLEVVHLVEGNPQKALELQGMVEDIINRCLHDYAGEIIFDVEIADAGADDEREEA